MRHAVIKFINTTSVVLFGLLLVFLPRTTDPDLAPPENVELVSAASEKVYVSRVTPVDKKVHRVWRVEWSDGKKMVLWPCKYEDSSRCYWDAGKRGNKTGHSFVAARNKVWYIS